MSPVPTAFRILFSSVLGLSKNLSDEPVASSRYNILLCSKNLVSDLCQNYSELQVLGLSRPVLFGRNSLPRSRGLAACVRDLLGAFPKYKF